MSPSANPSGLPAFPSLPLHTLVYAVGDVHGRRDLLDKLLAWLIEDFNAAGARVSGFLVLLGDYVDRGPDSKGVLDRLSTLALPPRLVPVLLRGNHEQMLTEALANPKRAAVWAGLGGAATMLSYGVLPPSPDGSMEEWRQATTALDAAIPAAHKRLLGALRPSMEIGDYFFAHAGVNPSRPLHLQSETDLIWIRDKFLRHDKSFGKLVVHGHSIAAEPMITPHRLGVDTGAYATGVLTCARIDQTGWQLNAIRLSGRSLWPDAAVQARPDTP
jgi:serine/threonine protein phosphatase 1